MRWLHSQTVWFSLEAMSFLVQPSVDQFPLISSLVEELEVCLYAHVRLHEQEVVIGMLHLLPSLIPRSCRPGNEASDSRELSLEPRPSSPRFYLAALEKNWGVRIIFLQGCERKSGRERPGLEAKGTTLMAAHI